MSGAADLGKALALASLPGVGPRRLRLLCGGGSPVEAFDRLVVAGPPPALADVGCGWSAQLRSADVDEVGQAAQRLGVSAINLGDAGYPSRLRHDPEAPAILFWRGTLGALDALTVGIVGTRRATPYGRRIAASFAEQLSRGGVAVVSGLAAGIDGAAHESVCALAASGVGASPVGVVGSGLDVVYPRRHVGLWQQVASRGLLISEAPLGARPEPWRFPLRNRILAALADVVVVVESGIKGGSMHTVEAALARGRTVLAVPGPISSPSSSGCNALLAAGAQVATEAADVFAALGLARPERVPPVPNGSLPTRPNVPATIRGHSRTVLDALAVEPLLADEISLVLGLSLLEVVRALGELEALGLVDRERGRWSAARVA